MNRDVLFGMDAQEGLIQGANILANAVKMTLGPKGRNVVFEDTYQGLHVTKDGVTVANNIILKDSHLRMGAGILKQAAQKTAELAGDGTTTSTVLAQAMINQSIKFTTSGASPINLKKGMDNACKQLISLLETKSKVINIDTVGKIATISANNDESIGLIIGEAYQKIGRDGVITVEDSNTSETYVDIVKGSQFDKGYLSPYFVTDATNLQVEYSSPSVLIYASKIEEASELDEVITYAKKNPLIIICDDISTEALTKAVLAKLRGSSKIAIVKAPYFLKKKEEYLEDLAVLLGTNVFSKEKGYKLKSVQTSYYGSCEKCVITAKETLFVNGHGEAESIENHTDKLKKEKELTLTGSEKERYDYRIARLTSGVAVLYVGASSEVELKEKKDRIDDALSACKTALSGGIITGGGITLFKLSKQLVVSDDITNFDEKAGFNIVINACAEPILQMAKNADLSGDVILYKILENKEEFNYGFDFKEEEYCNLFERDVIDPTNVAKYALENAVSVASMIIMTGCSLVNIGDINEGKPEYLIN